MQPFAALVLLCSAVFVSAAGPWNVKSLQATVPAHTWGSSTRLVQEVYYAGAPLNGKPTRVFAYVGRPENATRRSPGMVLVHGGGGKAFADWATHWAKRGYVAIAMDLAGKGPDAPLPDGGPSQDDKSKFREFTRDQATEMWSYHAVASVIRAHSLLASLPEVDPDRIGLTGISWGGYLTCIVAGLDHRFKVAVPVYGCGFLGENSVWKSGSLAALKPETRALWLELFDPSSYLADVSCPILFLNGSNDFAYPLDSYQRSFELVPEHLRNVSVVIKLPHGHIWTFKEVDAFVDSALGRGIPLPKLGDLTVADDVARTMTRTRALTNAQLHFTTDTNEWQKREWRSQPAKLELLDTRAPRSSISATLPPDRPLTFYLSATDSRGLRVSTGWKRLER